jgi:hypothetical protein
VSLECPVSSFLLWQDTRTKRRLSCRSGPGTMLFFGCFNTIFLCQQVEFYRGGVNH